MMNVLLKGTILIVLSFRYRTLVMAYRQLTDNEWEDLAATMHAAEIQLKDRDDADTAA